MNAKNIHTALAQRSNMQQKYGTNATGIYTVFHKKHFCVGGGRGKPNQTVVFDDKTEKDKNITKVDMNKLWLIVKKV